jgi:Family of unknown function (DUF5682)/VWA domain containing CoxE-like protein
VVSDTFAAFEATFEATFEAVFETTVDSIIESTDPVIIGVRHHSPSMSAAIPDLLAQAKPSAIALELPSDLQHWIEWLGHEELQSPVALSVTANSTDSTNAGRGLAFYPFADFSPELAAIRWARAHGVPVVAIDLPVGVVAGVAGAGFDSTPTQPTNQPTALERLLANHECDGFDELWDRMVEAHAPGQDAEELRRAGIRLGAILRFDEQNSGGVSARDTQREDHMCAMIERMRADGLERVVAVVGAFHAAALVSSESSGMSFETIDITSSLVPYRFDLLDSRSGYPAGIRDPQWQQSVFAAAGDAPSIDATLTNLTVDVARRLRTKGYVVSTPDAQEAVRVARDLAVLRGLPAPARRELVEGMQTAFVHGEALGRGRIVGLEMQTVLVGRTVGVLPKSAPRTGLAMSVEKELETLRLPARSGAAELDIRLEPWRSDLDCRRLIALHRLTVVGIPYGTIKGVAATATDSVEALTSRWLIQWEPSTDAMVALSAIYGPSLELATEGYLRRELRRAEQDPDTADVSIALLLELLHRSANAALPTLVDELIGSLNISITQVASFAELIAVLTAVDRLGAGLVPGLELSDSTRSAIRVLSDLAFTEALPRVESISGSDDPTDVGALAMLVARLAVEPSDVGKHPGRMRVLTAIAEISESGSPLMQGATTAAGLLLGRAEVATVASKLVGWIANSESIESRRDLARRLTGFFLLGSTAIVSEELLASTHSELMTFSDSEFLRTVPALRDGFSALSNADRRRVLALVGELFGLDENAIDRNYLETEIHPNELAMWMLADVEANIAVDALMLNLPEPTIVEPSEIRTRMNYVGSAGTLDALDRWRLILGHQRQQMTNPLASRAGAALDELYGRGRGEGSSDFDGGDTSSQGGGNEKSFPTARLWGDELLDVFGKSVREEILGRAAAGGRFDAALLLDPDDVQPSVALLSQVLSLRGSLQPGQLATLRKIVDRVVNDLVKQLANKVRPALTGGVGSRSSQRGRGPLNLSRTIADNLRNTTPAGLSIERFWFRERQRRTLDWRVIFVVDVSGSMEPSMIYSAMMAAIVNALPAVTSHFLAFSTDVIDFSGLVDDPLGLLLEVSVGGGTNIGKGLAFARTLVKVPSRTLMIVVSDFEEGGSVNKLVQEVRTLRESGVELLGLAALDDTGEPRFERRTAELLAGAGMEVAALTPLELARWVGERIR